MTTIVNIRSLLRGSPPVRINGVKLTNTVDVAVDLDVPQVRRDLHHFFGSWIVTGTPSETEAEANVTPATVAGGNLAAVDTPGGAGGWHNTGTVALLVTPSLVVTHVATAACSLAVGVARAATTEATQSIAAQDVHTATGTFVGSQVLVPAGQYLTVSTEAGASAGLIGTLSLATEPA